LNRKFKRIEKSKSTSATLFQVSLAFIIQLEKSTNFLV